MTADAQQRNFEVGPDFYERYQRMSLLLAEAERECVIFSEGLSALEKKLMVEADDAFFNEHGKRLAEAIQRRDAKAHPDYAKAIRAKARAQEAKITYKAQLEMMKMQFEEWRTRSADRRNSI